MCIAMCLANNCAFVAKVDTTRVLTRRMPISVRALTCCIARPSEKRSADSLAASGTGTDHNLCRLSPTCAPKAS